MKPVHMKISNRMEIMVRENLTVIDINYSTVWRMNDEHVKIPVVSQIFNQISLRIYQRLRDESGMAKKSY